MSEMIFPPHIQEAVLVGMKVNREIKRRLCSEELMTEDEREFRCRLEMPTKITGEMRDSGCVVYCHYGSAVVNVYVRSIFPVQIGCAGAYLETFWLTFSPEDWQKL